MGNLAYNRDHVRQVKFNFNVGTDADILAFLDTLENRQGYIKALIRADMAAHGNVQPAIEQEQEQRSRITLEGADGMKTYITKIGGKYYAFAGDTKQNQVYSIGSDNPPESTGASRYCAKWTDDGIQTVSNVSPSRNAAYQKAKRAGDYGGEV